MSKSKAKGTAEETLVADYLNSEGILCVRHPPQGAKDKGDINLLSLSAIIEVKNCKTMSLASWVDEAQAEKANAGKDIALVWHKRIRRGKAAEHYVTLTGEDAVKLLKAYGKM
jgi:hypothetical protein